MLGLKVSIFCVLITISVFVTGQSENANSSEFVAINDSNKNIIINQTDTDECKDNDTCIRLCCDKPNHCSEEMILKFDKKLELDKKFNSSHIKLLKRPACEMYEPDTWELMDVSKEK
jgi:hypothetical protein